MSDFSAPIGDLDSLDAEGPGMAGPAARSLPRLAQYAAPLLFVALATGFALIVEERVGAPNLTLIFVLPVIGAATAFGWGPSLLATLASVLAFDFFFTEPKYSLVIASPADVWAAGLLLVIATIVSALAAGIPAPAPGGGAISRAGAGPAGPGAWGDPLTFGSRDSGGRRRRPRADLSRPLGDFHGPGRRVPPRRRRRRGQGHPRR